MTTRSAGQPSAGCAARGRGGLARPLRFQLLDGDSARENKVGGPDLGEFEPIAELVAPAGGPQARCLEFECSPSEATSYPFHYGSHHYP